MRTTRRLSDDAETIFRCDTSLSRLNELSRGTAIEALGMSLPGSVTRASLASKVMPSLVGLAQVTWPIGAR